LSDNEDRLKALIENNPVGVPWMDIAEALGFTADPEKS
jgi:hypothetical protein